MFYFIYFLFIQGLARSAIDDAQLLWKIRPKHHMSLNSFNACVFEALFVVMYFNGCGYKTAKVRSFSARPVSTTEPASAEYI